VCNCMEVCLKCFEFTGGLLATVEDRARGLESGIGEPAFVSFAFEFTIRGDGDLARAFREGDKDWDR